MHTLSIGTEYLDRDLAQLVAHTSGGREVAGSSPVIPTERERLRITRFLAFFLFIGFLKVTLLPNFWDKLRRNVISGDIFIIGIGR